MNIENIEDFPLSKNKKIKGTRRMVREKVLQILFASNVSETEVDELFTHIFYRDFNLNEDVVKHEKLLKPDEIIEIEADIPVKWKPDEIQFSKKLIYQTLSNKSKIDTLIKENSQNWEIERIDLIDRLLIHICITELIDFPEIPPKVSINEAIDIAKKYSTPKSSYFINGVIDAIHNKLKANGEIKKEGRGLKES